MRLQSTIVTMIIALIAPMLCLAQDLSSHIPSDSFSGFWRWKAVGDTFDNSSSLPFGVLFLNEHENGLVSGHSLISLKANHSASAQINSAIFKFPIEGRVEIAGGTKTLKFKVFGRDGFTMNESEAYLSMDGQSILGKSIAIYSDKGAEKSKMSYSWKGRRF